MYRKNTLLNSNYLLKKKAVYAAVGVTIFLISIKLFAWVQTQSISILSTLTDSILDFASSIMNLLAVHHASRPPTDEYKFGHSKLEALGALVQAVLLVVSGSFILNASADRLINPSSISHPQTGIIILIISLFVTIALVLYQRKVIRKTNSVAVMADSMHYSSDIFLNIGGFIAIEIYMWFGWSFFDALVGALVACYIFFAAYIIVRKALRILLDAEIPLVERQNVHKILKNHIAVKKVEQYKTRTSGDRNFIYATLCMHHTMTLLESHRVIKKLEKNILKLYPHSEVSLSFKPFKKKT